MGKRNPTHQPLTPAHRCPPHRQSHTIPMVLPLDTPSPLPPPLSARPSLYRHASAILLFVSFPIGRLDTAPPAIGVDDLRPRPINVALEPKGDLDRCIVKCRLR